MNRESAEKAAREMAKYWRLLRSVQRGISRSYTVWKMNEACRAGHELYSCATCGMGDTEPCEHWQRMLANSEPIQ